MNKSFDDRFWERVEIRGPDECWLWTGRKLRDGYGQIWSKGKLIRTHRLSWELTKGKIPDGLCVLHNCPGGDNPACVNPKHLFLGTQEENIKDMVNKGRQSGAIGEHNGRAKLTVCLVNEIRELFKTGLNKQQLANRFGVSRSQIYSIVTGLEWKDGNKC